MLLTDDARDARNLPTRKNMINAMKWLVQGAKCHDSLFFHCKLFGDREDIVELLTSAKTLAMVVSDGA